MPCKGELNVLTDTYNTIFIMFEQENKAYGLTIRLKLYSTGIIISTRRFNCFPSAVSFVATGLLSPYPFVVILAVTPADCK